MTMYRPLIAGSVFCVLLLVNSLFIENAASQTVALGGQNRQLQRQPNSVKQLPSKAKRWALIIGVDQYRDGQIGALKGSVNDARALANALTSYAGFPSDQVIVLTTDQPDERQPTRINILTYLSNLASLVPKDGLFLFSFAGHGIERGGQAFLIPSDARLSRDISLLEESAVSVTRMHDRIKAIGVGQVIVMLDACRNDPGGRAGAPNNMTAAYTKFNFDVRNREVEAFATLYATAVGQRAYEYTEKKQGYFTWALVEGLKGGAANENGEITLSSLVKYIQSNVPKRIAIDLGSNEQQKPFAIIEGYRADELILAVSTTRAAAETSVSQPDPLTIEMGFWDSIKNSSHPEDYSLYLSRYPNGMFAEIAKRRLEPTTSTSTPAAPTVDQLLADYFNALGGAGAIAKLKTMIRKGSYEASYRERKVTGEVELYEKRPGKHLLIIKSGRAVSKEVYDGDSGWLGGTGGATKPATAHQLATHKRSQAWDLANVETVKRAYLSIVVKGKRRLDDRDCFVIEATTPEGKIDTIYLDAETKLIHRWDLPLDSVAVQQGIMFQTQLYFSEYIEINGVKLPMTIRQVQSGGETTIKFDMTKLQFNVPIDDKYFKKP